MPKLIAIYAMTATVEVTIQNREDLVVTGNEAVPQPLRIVAVRVKSGQIEAVHRFTVPFTINELMDGYDRW
jgi:hypothetical protein